jgi:hypothetical protein
MVVTTVCDLHTGGGGISNPVQFVTLYKLLVISKMYFQKRVSDMVNRTPLGIMAAVGRSIMPGVPFRSSRTMGSFLQYWSPSLSLETDTLCSLCDCPLVRPRLQLPS